MPTREDDDVSVETPTAETAAEHIGALFGPIAAREAKSAGDRHAASLIEYADKLAGLDEQEYLAAASYAIWDAASVARFRAGVFEDIHCRSTMVYAEAVRRHHAAGHDEDCLGGTLYSQAWNDAVRQAGHPDIVKPLHGCTCGDEDDS